MTAIEKRMTLENVDMMSFLGMNDANIKIVEDRFNTSITVRGQNVILKGVLEEACRKRMQNFFRAKRI